MSADLEFLPEAKRDAEEAVRFYEQRVPGLGARFRIQIEIAGAAILRQPLLWRARPGGYRRFNIPGFPYYVAYVVRGERILIVAVGHASRRPDFWTKRRES